MAMMVGSACIGELPLPWGRQGGCGSGYATYSDLDPREHPREHLPGLYNRSGSAAVVTSTLKDLRGIRSIHALNSSHCLLPPGEPHLAPAAVAAAGAACHSEGGPWFVPPSGGCAAWGGAEAWQRAQAAAAAAAALVAAAGPPTQQQDFMQPLHSAPFDNSHATASSAAMCDRTGSNQVLSPFYAGAGRSQTAATCAGSSPQQALGQQQQVHGFPADAQVGGDAQAPPPKIGAANQFKDSSSYLFASPEKATAQFAEEVAPARRSRAKSGPKTIPSCMPCLVPCRLGCS